MAATEGQLDGDGADAAQVGWRHTLRQIRRDPTAMAGLVIVVFVVAVATFSMIDSNLHRLTFGSVERYYFAELIPGLENPEEIPPPGELNAWESAWFVEGSLLSLQDMMQYQLGTDHQGRDYLSRIVYGSRISVSVGISASLLGLFGGVTIGAVAGYYGGWVDDVLMRLVETIYSIPALILVIVFTVFASRGDPDVTYAVIGVSITAIPVFARIIRSRVLSVREMEYIEAARAAGVTDYNIILRHVIPNSFAPVLVYATLYIGVSILIVAGLSFLGYGAQPPTPDWGAMLDHSHGQMHSNPWSSVWPGMAILIAVMGFNLFGDGLQDALDPRIKN